MEINFSALGRGSLLLVFVVRENSCRQWVFSEYGFERETKESAQLDPEIRVNAPMSAVDTHGKFFDPAVPQCG